MDHNLDKIPHVFWVVLACIAIAGIVAVYSVIIKPHFDREAKKGKEDN